MHRHTTEMHQTTKAILNTNIITIIAAMITMGMDIMDMGTVTDTDTAAANKKQISTITT